MIFLYEYGVPIRILDTVFCVSTNEFTFILLLNRILSNMCMYVCVWVVYNIFSLAYIYFIYFHCFCTNLLEFIVRVSITKSNKYNTCCSTIYIYSYNYSFNSPNFNSLAYYNTVHFLPLFAGNHGHQ